MTLSITRTRQRLVSATLDQPDAYLILAKVKIALAEEAEQKIKFYHVALRSTDKIEFINGQTISSLPEEASHEGIRQAVNTLLGEFVKREDIGLATHNKLIACTRNVYQPDFCFFHKDKGIMSDEEPLLPPPDFVVEILSKQSENYDREVKLIDYCAHKVAEYWILDPETLTLEQYHLEGDEYKLIHKSRNGFIVSFALPGLEIPVMAIFDKEENLKAIQQF
jgi:Uma2 family endonuclease